MLHLFGKFSYKLITTSLRMPVFDLLREFEHTEKMTKDQLVEYQWNKLKKLIRHAALFSPYYKKIFKDLGAEPEDIKDIHSFKKIPVLTKDIIQNRKNEILVHPKSIFSTIEKTSGSTGNPLKFYKDPLGKASTYAAMYRCHRWYGIGIGAKEARLWSVPVGNIQKMKITCIDFLLNRIRQTNSEINDKTFRKFYYNMEKFQPEYLMGYPSLIYLFAKFLISTGLNGNRLKLKFVKCTAEVVSDYQKMLIEDVFGCQCISEYGAAETGIIAFECPERKHHIMADSVFVEFENNKFDIKKLFQNLIVTNLYNFIFPIIRYDIGDLAVFQDEMCSCGRSLPLMSQVVGRVHDVIVGSNGKIIHSSIFALILKNLIKCGINCRQIRFVQAEPGNIQVQIVPTNNVDREHSDALMKIIKRAFEDNINVEIKYFPTLQRDPSGKFRYFVSTLENYR